MNISKILKGASIKRKLFLSFSAIICFQILIVWIFGYSFITNIINKKNGEDFQRISTKINEAYSSAFTMSAVFNSSIKTSFLDLMLNSSDKIDYYQITKYTNNMSINIGLNDTIKGFFVYSPEKNITISNFSLTDSPSIFFNSYIKLKSIDNNDLYNIVNNLKYNKIILDNIKYSINDEECILLLYNISDIVGKSKSNVVGIIIPQSNIINKVSPILPNNTTIFIYDNTNKYVYANDSSSTQEFMEILFNQKDIKPGIQTKKINSSTYYISSSSIGYGLNCLIFTQQADYLKKLRDIQLIMILFLFFILLAGIFAIYYNSIKTTKPIDNIKLALEKVSSISREQKNNELDWIEKNIKQLVIKEAEISESMKDSLPNLRSFYISKLLQNVTSDTIYLSTGLRLANIDFKYSNFVCCVISSDISRDTLIKISEDIYNTDILEITFYYTYLESQNYIAYAISFNEQNNLTRLINNINSFLLDHDTNFIIGIGNVKDNIFKLNESFEEACYALSFKSIGDIKNIIYFKDTIDKKNTSYSFPQNLERYLINYIKAGDSEKAKNILKELINENTQNENASMLILKNFYTHALITILRAIDNSSCNISNIYTIQSLSKLNSNKHIIEYLNNMIDDVCKINLEGKANGKGNELKSKILDYIDNNYSNPNLSLTLVAEYLGIHKVYLSTYFNEKIGCSFVEYVNRKRVEKSLYYLDKDNLIIAEIAKLSGFNSEATYRREFKKYNGMSPSEYKTKLVNKTF